MSNRPISQPLRRETEETWKQVIDLFRKHGLSEPPVRLRDELVVALEWAWYGAALQSAADTPAPPPPQSHRRGIYIASKTKHADRWRRLREAGFPIISTWIDEAGAGESGDLSDLWRRCILEASTASALVLYREPDDVLKGGWVELGAALACGVPVFAVGIEEFTIAKDKRIRHFATLHAALAATATEDGL